MAVPPRIYLQEACLKHRYIRGRDTTDVYERPERIRAINIGLGALYARLEEANGFYPSQSENSRIPANASASSSAAPGPLTLVRSAAKLDMRNDKAALAIHSGTEEDGKKWALVDDIEEWCAKSISEIQRNGSEIPEGFEQDLYVCPDSLQAFEGALGTVCEAVDHVCMATGISAKSKPDPSSSNYVDRDPGIPSPRAFVVVRPPGHHCSEDTPAGFGFFNNVAVGALHAFERHYMTRIVIFDIDLHHGNGTQELVRSFLTPSIFYGSTHDILSYPTESGDPDLIRDASLQIPGTNGEWIHNVHLLEYRTEDEFWRHYSERYQTLFDRAELFIESTGGASNTDNVMVFMSCGFDASEYETTEMSRHNRHVPTSFYHRFTADACAFANKYAGGRLVSVLEGGYSDRALMSGALSHVAGLAEAGGFKVDRQWWSPDELNKIEKVTRRRRGRKPKLDHAEWWIQRMQQVFEHINKDPAPPFAVPGVSQLFALPAQPPPPVEAPAPPLLVKKPRKRRTKPPPPPPTTMLTRRAKRASPSDDQEHAGGAPTSKRARLDDRQEEEEESSETDSADSDYAPAPRRLQVPRVDGLPSAPASPSGLRRSGRNTEPWRMEVDSKGSTGLPTPLPSVEDLEKANATAGGSQSQHSRAETRKYPPERVPEDPQALSSTVPRVASSAKVKLGPTSPLIPKATPASVATTSAPHPPQNPSQAAQAPAAIQRSTSAASHASLSTATTIFASSSAQPRPSVSTPAPVKPESLSARSLAPSVVNSPSSTGSALEVEAAVLDVTRPTTAQSVPAPADPYDLQLVKAMSDEVGIAQERLKALSTSIGVLRDECHVVLRGTRSGTT